MKKVTIDGRPLQSSHRFRGIGTYTRQLLLEFQRVGLDNINVLMLNTADRRELTRLPTVAVNRPVEGKLGLLAEQVLTPWDLWRHNVELMHFVDWNVPVVRVRPTIITVFDLIPFVFPHQYMRTKLSRVFFTLQQHAIEHAQHVITASEHSKSDLVRLFGVPAERISVIPLAADAKYVPISDQSLLESVKERYALHEPFLLYTGSFLTPDPRKNVNMLVDAVRLMADRGTQLNLVLAGAIGAYSEEIRAHAVKRGVEQRVRFIGYVSDDELRALYNLTTLFVFPSRYEGFGLPPLEAMACGAPVAVAGVSSLPEVVGPAGLTFSPDDVDELDAIVRRILDEPVLRRTMQMMNVERAASFSWARTAEATARVYRRL